MKYLSLFTGIGGFELGIQQAHVALTDRDTNGTGQGGAQKGARGRKGLVAAPRKASIASRRWNGELPDRWPDERAPDCVGYSEIDRHAIDIYQRHFPNHKNYGDITKIDASDLPDFDLLVGGFPCQSFSIAGKRRGFDDTRGTLFFDIARLLDAKRPRLLLLENVKGLLSHDEGATFKTIILALDDLGYDLQWQVLNSKNHGVPQNRERVFIVGHLRGTPRPQVFPFTEGDTGADEARSGEGEEVAHTLKAKQGGPDLENSYHIIARNQRGEVRRMDVSGSLTGNRSAKQFSYLRIPEATKKGYAEAGIGDSMNLSVMGSKTRRGRVGKGIAQTLDTGMQQYTIQQRPRGKNRGGERAIAPAMTGKSYQDNNPLISKTVRTGGRGSPHGSKQNWDSYDVAGGVRRLTPLECERLQGFPDSWTTGISDTQRYKCLGNAVTVNVVRDVMIKLLCKSPNS